MTQLNSSDTGYLNNTGYLDNGNYQYDDYEYTERSTSQNTPSRRGFAAMDQQRQKEIASKGGRTAHAKGTAHEFTSQEATAAGRKGGHAAHAKGTAHEFTPQEAAEAGRKGGRRTHNDRDAKLLG